MNFNDKVIIITGGSSGIGKETVKLFAREGAKVVIGDINNNQKLIDECKKTNKNIMFVKTKIQSKQQVKNLIKKTVNSFGKIDILYNAVGVYGPPEATIVDLDVTEWDRVIGINLRGTFLTSKFVIPEMLKSGGGAIVNTGSTVSFMGDKKASAYCATKAAIVNLTRQIAVDYSGKGIRANCICPGFIDTEFHNNTIRNNEWLKTKGFKNTNDFINKFIKGVPIGRIGKPEEIAQVIAFLVSDKASFITGSVIVADGGQIAQI